MNETHQTDKIKNEANPAPFTLRPHYRTVVWGGSRIADLKGEALPYPCVGESWEVSDLPAGESIIAGGAAEFEGMPLSAIMAEYAPQILGKRLHRIYGNAFPLLVKIIDAEKDLSIQVHPDDYMAMQRHKCNGKTELWYTLSASEGAYIYSGLRDASTPEELRQHIAEGTLSDLLARFTPRHGDFFYLPAGRIHSIGAGTMVLEIQQPSDITYRIYDYDRLDFDGKKRTLHIEEALEAIDFRVHSDYKRHIDARPGREQVLQECPHFTATLIRVGTKPFVLDIARYLSFRVLVATEGSGTIIDNFGHKLHLRRGHTAIVPAITERVTLIPDEGCTSFELVTAYIQ